MDYFVFKNNEQLGPFALMDVRERLKNGVFSYEDLAWREGMADWSPLKEIMGGSLPDATPHSVSPSTPASTTATGTAPTALRWVTAIVLFCILFVIFSIILFILECIVGGIYVVAHNMPALGQPQSAEVMHDAGHALGEKYAIPLLGVCFLGSLVASSLTAWKMAFSNLFPWCRTR